MRYEMQRALLMLLPLAVALAVGAGVQGFDVAAEAAAGAAQVDPAAAAGCRDARAASALRRHSAAPDGSRQPPPARPGDCPRPAPPQAAATP